MSKSNTAAPVSKPKRPMECPLFAHPTGRWAKKIRGRLVYFGKWDDLDGVLTRWAEQNDALLAGLPVASAKPDMLSEKQLVNEFLNSRRLRVEAGETTQRAFPNYQPGDETMDDRLRAVSDHVHRWLFGEKTQQRETVATLPPAAPQAK